MFTRLWLKPAALVLVIATLAACASPAPTPTATLPAPTATMAPPTATPLPPTDTPAPQPTLEPLPPEPQRIEFQAEDGTNLVGLYYPAAVNPAPLVILMHMAGENKESWVDVGMVAWLQNRGQTGGQKPPRVARLVGELWPPMPEGMSFGVFAFDFRGHGESGGKFEFNPAGWLQDAQAAIKKAKELPGVDPNRILAIGASIGADAAIDVCYAGCIGALSLSPGGYLDIAYDGEVKRLGETKTPAWCFADDKEKAMCDSLKDPGEHYQFTIFPNAGHGTDMLKPNLDPPIGEVILDFLESIVAAR